MRQIANRQRIYCGIDTHADTHHAAVITDTGILLEHRQFDTTATGYDDLTLWIRELGEPIAVGIEGTSSYGAGIARHLRHLKITVVEVPRPNRKLRRSVGKSDPIDAEAAARAVLARHQLSEPKHGDGPIEAIRALRVARSSAVKAATASMNAIRAMLVTAPDTLRAQLRGRRPRHCSMPAPHSTQTLPNWPTRSTQPFWHCAHSPTGHVNYAEKQTN